MKRKKDNLTLPAKVKTPISLTSARIKLTLQNYCLENIELKSEIEQMQKEIQNQSLPVNNNLEKDLISIMLNANCKDIPPRNYFGRNNKNIYLLPKQTSAIIL